MKDRKISLTLTDRYEFQQEFKSLKSLYSFVKKEHGFWLMQSERAKENSSESHPALDVCGFFETFITTIDRWKTTINDWDDTTLNQQVQTLNANPIRQLTSRWLWSGSNCVEQFIIIFINYNTATANSFLDYITKQAVVMNNNDINSLNGALLGYEFVNQSSEISKRRLSEKKSIGQLRSNYSNAQNELFTEVEEIKLDIKDWDNKTQNKFSRLYEVNKYLGERRVKHHDNQFNNILRTWSATVDELEQTYEEKLRLDKPAQYWHKAAKKYGLQGSLWTIAIIAMVLLGLVYFREFFITWLEGKETGIKLNTVQGIIIFGSFAATFAYLLKVLSRLTFSAFHLMRDAEEREQLTYLYLSLTNESAIDKDSRDIVLQALFSRSETGLLTNEHGPTMPMSDAIKLMSKGNR